jgi:hypothetical protein
MSTQARMLNSWPGCNSGWRGRSPFSVSVFQRAHQSFSMESLHILQAWAGVGIYLLVNRKRSDWNKEEGREPVSKGTELTLTP